MPHHGASPAYAPAVLRNTSPASSVVTLPADDTLSDIELSQTAFESKWNTRIGVYGLMDASAQKEDREKEQKKCGNPLLPEVPTAAEEQGTIRKTFPVEHSNVGNLYSTFREDYGQPQRMDPSV
jgi:hypothetical protein